MRLTSRMMNLGAHESLEASSFKLQEGFGLFRVLVGKILCLIPRDLHTDTSRPYGVSGSWPGPSGASCSQLLL